MFFSTCMYCHIGLGPLYIHYMHTHTYSSVKNNNDDGTHTDTFTVSLDMRSIPHMPGSAFLKATDLESVL